MIYYNEHNDNFTYKDIIFDNIIHYYENPHTYLICENCGFKKRYKINLHEFEPIDVVAKIKNKYNRVKAIAKIKQSILNEYNAA